MFEKYLKYKKKYLALKGGFALSQECYGEPYKIDAETDDKELKEGFLYPKMKKYFENNIEFYNKYLKIINDYSENKETNKPPIKTIDEIIEYFESDNHKQILTYLLDKFIEDDLINYHVQYTSLIFLSFIIELELFMVCYSIVPYNTITNPDNNNLNIEWASSTKKPTYYKLLDSDIISLFNKYTCSLELKYKEYIDTLIGVLIENKDEIKIKKIFYKDNKDNKFDYRHINHDWINRLKLENIFDDNVISKLIKKTLDKINFKYNAMINGLFDLIFSNFEASCLTKSLIELYYLSRSHINYESLYLNLEIKTSLKYLTHETLHESLNTTCTHWSCSCMKTDIRSIYEDKIKLTFENKDEILISLIFFTYDEYYYYFRYRDIPRYSKFRKFIRKKQKFLLNKLYSVEKLFFASMKKNLTYVWKNTDDNIKFGLLNQGLKTNKLQYTDIPPEIILEGLKTEQLLYTDIPLKFILKHLKTKNLIFSDIPENLKLKIFSDIANRLITYTELSNDIIYEGLNNKKIQIFYIPDNIIFEGLNNKILKYEDIPINMIFEGLNENDLKYKDVPDNIIFKSLNKGELKYEDVPDNIIFEGLNKGELNYEDVPDNIISEGLSKGQLEYEDLSNNKIFEGLNKGELKYKDVPNNIIFKGLIKRKLKYYNIPKYIIFEGLNKGELKYENVPINDILEGLDEGTLQIENVPDNIIFNALNEKILDYKYVPGNIILKGFRNGKLTNIPYHILVNLR
jgi:hypothetical protein